MLVELALLGLLSPLVGSPVSSETPPDAIPGLVAWLNISTLHKKLRSGSQVETWPDSSGHERHLVDQKDGISATFEIQQFGRMPAVRIGKANTHRLADGLALDDHTIFLVMRASCAPCGLMHSTIDGEQANGILLNGDANRHFLHLFGRSLPYTDPLPHTDRFGLTILARQSGALRAFINGEDVSSFGDVDKQLRCDRLFHLPITTAVRIDGEGLQLAEMLVYDRFLAQTERRAVSAYLARKFDLELSVSEERKPPIRPELIRATLHPRVGQTLSSVSSSFVEWKVDGPLHSGLRQGTEDEGRSLVFAVTEQSHLRLQLQLVFEPVEFQAPISVGLLKNGADWIVPDFTAQRGSDGRGHAVVDVTVRLNVGESLQVVVFPPEGLEQTKIELSGGSRWVLAEAWP